LDERTLLINYLKDNGVLSVFHYLNLHNSEYYKNKHDGRKLANCDYFANCLVRLPMFFELKMTDVEKIVELIHCFFIS
jgi:dTDP-4-amino-4,6-dideoxygalactose transaminase